MEEILNLNPQTVPQAFISHSHLNKEVAEQVGNALAQEGISPWLDKWEILPGDSIPKKVFEEGIKKSSVFIFLLSPESLQSKWVTDEREVATIKRINGEIRLITIKVSKCDAPEALRHLHWEDLTKNDLNHIAKRIADAVFNRTQKPKVLPTPSLLDYQVSDLSAQAAQIAVSLMGLYERELAYINEEISEKFHLTLEQVNDAVEELEEMNLIKTIKTLGTHPYNFLKIWPTYQLAMHLRGTPALVYDPQQDVFIVASAVVASNTVICTDLQELTKLPIWRMNNAVEWLKDYQYANVLQTLGTHPYKFYRVTATGATRRLVTQNQEHFSVT